LDKFCAPIHLRGFGAVTRPDGRLLRVRLDQVFLDEPFHARLHEVDARGPLRRDPNATQAAIRAGYSPKAARFVGCKNITKANIAAAIEKAQAKRAERCELTADWVVEEFIH
jgi:hypothetical protein